VRQPISGQFQRDITILTEPCRGTEVLDEDGSAWGSVAAVVTDPKVMACWHSSNQKISVLRQSQIAESLGFEPAAIRILKLASTMHDVGKIGVPDSILLKRGPLSAQERAEMQKHAERGCQILEGRTSDVVRLAAEIAESHHERWDGTGYTKGLKGGAIPLSGRIVAVADVFDALVSERPYETAWLLDRARAYVADQVGVQFDPRCVDAFLSGWDEVEQTWGGAA